MEYKDTLNLPKTDFPMKANLPNKEPNILKTWAEKSVFEQALNQSSDNKSIYSMMALPMQMVTFIWSCS